MMINKFSLNYINYRLHQLFYFRQIIKRDSFNILIDKKIIPLYNIKNFILRFHHHEHEEIKLIKKNLFPTNTLELGCSLMELSKKI